MIKRILSALLVVTFSSGWVSVLADNGMGQKLDNAVAKWNAQNKGTAYEIKNIDDETRDYIESLPSNVDIEIYKREIPDITKSLIRADKKVQVSDETLPWYKEGTPEEKRAGFIERIKMVENVNFDGYAPKYKDSVGTVLGNFLMGDEQNIKKANQLIVEKYGEDESLFYHSGVTTPPIGDGQLYIIWYDFQDKLTPEARDALYRQIVRVGRCNVGFSPYGASLQMAFNCFHNQGVHGLVEGLMYAQIADDDRMLKRMEDYIDRCIAQMAALGDVGEQTSPGYGGVTYAGLQICYLYAEDERIKSKLELMLDWNSIQMANNFHYPSNSQAGAFHRAYGSQLFQQNDSADYRTIINMAAYEPFFSATQESMGSGWWIVNAAHLNFYFPEWANNLLKHREYPYSVKSTVKVDDEPEQLGKQFGNFFTTGKQITELNIHMTEEYTLSGRAPTWYTVGRSQQDVAFRATWRRNADVSDIKDVSDIAYMWPMYTYNTDLAKQDYAKVAATHPSWDIPNGWGKEFPLVYKNKAIVTCWPGRVGDYGTSTKTAHYTLPIDSWESMGATMLITNYEELKGIWFGDRFIEGQVQVLEAGDEEVRIKLVGEGVPARLKGDEKIYLEDFNTYVCLQPLNSTNLGREYDVTFIDYGNEMTKKVYMTSNSVDQGPTIAYHNPLLITAYNYYGEETTHTFEERVNQRNGFIVEMGEKKDYATIKDFASHMDTTSFESYDDGKVWTVKYNSGDDSMELNTNIMNMVLEESYVNGEPIITEHYEETSEIRPSSSNTLDPETKITYGQWNRMDFFDYLDYEPFKNCEMIRTETMVQSTKKEFTLGDITVENPAGCSCTIVYEPYNDEYIFINYTDKTSNFKITTPDGVINIENMNYGKVIYRPGEENELETKVVPRMTLLDTNVTVTGKE